MLYSIFRTYKLFFCLLEKIPHFKIPKKLTEYLTAGAIGTFALCMHNEAADLYELDGARAAGSMARQHCVPLTRTLLITNVGFYCHTVWSRAY